VIKCGPQTAEADVSGGRDNIGERDCGRAIEILERCAVAGAEAEIAHAKLIARKVRRPGLLRGEHARIGRGKIPAQMHDRFKVVISVGDTRWVNGEPENVCWLLVDVVRQYREVAGLIGPDIFVSESKRVPHLVADLRAAEAG